MEDDKEFRKEVIEFIISTDKTYKSSALEKLNTTDLVIIKTQMQVHPQDKKEKKSPNK